MNLFNRCLSRYEEIGRLLVEQSMDDKNLQVTEEFESLESAGLEEDSRQQPCFGNNDNPIQIDPCKGHYEGGVVEYVQWFSDGEDTRYDIN